MDDFGVGITFLMLVPIVAVLIIFIFSSRNYREALHDLSRRVNVMEAKMAGAESRSLVRNIKFADRPGTIEAIEVNRIVGMLINYLGVEVSVPSGEMRFVESKEKLIESMMRINTKKKLRK